LKLVYFINVDWYFNLHWLERAKASRSAGHEVHIVTQLTDPIYRKTFQEAGLILHEIELSRSSVSPFSLRRTFIQAKKIIGELQPDLLHCITVKPNIIGGLIARDTGIKTIFNVTGVGLAFSSTKLTARLMKLAIVAFYRRILDRDHYRLIFENADDSDLFLDMGLGSTKTHVVIPGAGVDIDKFSYTAPKNNGEGPLQVLFASRMLWDKGIQDLIDACQLLIKKGHRLQLNVAGLLDHDTRGAIPEKDILKWHERGYINWLGEISDMATLLKQSDVVVLPTYFREGVPRILIEAAACGRPCIATDVSGCRKVVLDGRTGYLVPTHSPQVIAEKLKLFLDDYSLVEKMGKEGRALVESTFEQSIVIEQIFQTYKSVAA